MHSISNGDQRTQIQSQLDLFSFEGLTHDIGDGLVVYGNDKNIHADRYPG